MPIPIIYAVGAGLALLLGGTAVYVAINWDDIVRKLTGKRIAILGERGVGKTTMYTFLSSGTLPEKYELTEGIGVRVHGRRFELRDLKLVIKDGRDVPGSTDAVKYLSLWKKTVEDSDIIVLMVRADKLTQEDRACTDLAVSDARHIAEWRRGQDCFVVGTHFDLLPEFASLTDKTSAQFLDRFRAIDSVQEIRRTLGLPPERVLLGSQKTTDHTGLLVAQMFRAIIS
jgi:hypothetical protein